MSNHKTPLTELERTGLIAHGLERSIGKPSQLADVFRQGVAWAIKQAEQAQPVGTVKVMGSYKGVPALGCLISADGVKVGDKLYTTPPRQPWVGLTDEEINTEWVLTPQNDKAEGIWFGRRIEAKLKEKNT